MDLFDRAKTVYNQYSQYDMYNCIDLSVMLSNQGLYNEGALILVHVASRAQLKSTQATLLTNASKLFSDKTDRETCLKSAIHFWIMDGKFSRAANCLKELERCDLKSSIFNNYQYHRLKITI